LGTPIQKFEQGRAALIEKATDVPAAQRGIAGRRLIADAG